MSSVVVLQHVPFEGPGRIAPVFRDFGIPIDLRRLDRGDEVPRDPREIRALIVLGGPMGVGDIGKSPYPFLAAEVDLIRHFFAEDRPFLGICLGAQLLAHAAGARVFPNTRPGHRPEDPPLAAPEFGWGPVTFPFPGGTDPVLMGLMDGAMMFHWHRDTFELPRLPAPPGGLATPGTSSGAVLLSSTAICRNQAFRLKGRLYGFQYHFEMDQAGIEAMLEHGRDDLVQTLGPGAPEQLRHDTERHYRRYERLGDRVLRNLVEYLKLY